MPKRKSRRSGKKPLSTHSYQMLEQKRLLAVTVSNDAPALADSVEPQVVSVEDFQEAYRSSTGANQYDSGLDYDGNGVVNSVDLLKFRQFYQQQPIPLVSDAPLIQSSEPVVAEAQVFPNPSIDFSVFDVEGPSFLQADGSFEFDALNSKHVSPNGNGWRHELKIDSNYRVAMTDTYEDFSANIKFDLSVGSKLIATQYHAGGSSSVSTLVKLYVDDHHLSSSSINYADGVGDNGIFDVYVRLRRDDGSGEDVVPLGSIVSGESFDFRVVNDYGDVTIQGMGVEETRTVLDSDGSYLKFGSYLQAQDVNGNNVAANWVTVNGVRVSQDWADFYANEGITENVVTFEDVNYIRHVDGTSSDTTAPTVASTVVNNGATQRSTVDSLTVTLNGLVTIAPDAVNVIQRSDASGLTGTSVDTTFSADASSGDTVLTINFDSSTRNGIGALEDGYYQITLDQSKIKRAGLNMEMAQDYVFGNEAVDNFYSYFGESTGDSSVQPFDLLTFRQTYRNSVGDSSYNASLDYDGNGTVNAIDLLRFRQRYRTTLTAPADNVVVTPPVSPTVVNPSFEPNFWGWIEDEPVRTSGVVVSGANSAKVDIGGLISQNVAVEPNTNYELRAWVEGGGRLGVTVGGNTFDSIGNAGQNFALHTVPFSSGSANSVLIFGEAASEEARFDDFSIVAV